MHNIERLTVSIERWTWNVECWALKNPKGQGQLARTRTLAGKQKGALFCFLDRPDNGVEVRPIAGVEFGMEQFAIGANLESAATRRN